MKEESLIQSNNNTNTKNTISRGIENLYQFQIAKIAEIKSRKCDFESNTLLRSEDISLAKQRLLFNDSNNLTTPSWEYCSFQVMETGSENVPVIESNWKQQDSTTSYNSSGIEIQNKLYSSINRIDYDLSNCEISASFILKGESSFWLFLRAEQQMDEYTSALKVHKRNQNQKVFLSMGTFISETPHSVAFKVFSKQQIIDKSPTKANYYMYNDTCTIRLVVYDTGEETIMTRIYFNDSIQENIIENNIFLPTNDKRKIMFSASGDYCLVKEFCGQCSLKDTLVKKGNINSLLSDKKNCNCCIVF